jgi:hypothetical protein
MKTAKDIFQDILASANTNCVLKIKLRNVENPIITAVERIGNKRILLKPTCLYGYKLKERYITIPQIESVTRYKTQFDHPLFQKLRFIKNNISEIKKSFRALNPPQVVKPRVN